MKRNYIALVSLAFFFILSSSLHAGSPFAVPDKSSLHPKLESVLSELHEQSTISSAAVNKFAEGRLLKVTPQEEIMVFLILKDGKTIDDIDLAVLQSYGVNVIKNAGNVIQASMPLIALKTVADNVDGINFIQLPDKPHSDYILSEGVSLTTNSYQFYNSGYSGQGVKVAVIDLGFKGLSSALASGELPSVHVIDCTGPACVTVYSPWDSIESEQHGTAVAEIVYDMAPDAELHLIKIANRVDLAFAKEFCKAHGIKVVNHSVGWRNENFYDGKCYNSNPVCTVDDAFWNGIFWANATGNFSNKHYAAYFTDANTDGWHDQSITLNASEGQNIDISLTWDAWPNTNQDFDLYLYDSAFNLVASSQNTQTGSQTPTEQINKIAPYTGLYHISIFKYSATTNPRFKLYTVNMDIVPSTAMGSLVSPADAAGAFGVAAIDYPDWLTGPIASYSSQGPTTDGRKGTMISGPAATSTFTYGPNAFSGTSAASPHVAGAAALLFSSFSYTNLQVGNILINSAIDMGSPGLDSVYGAGRLNLPVITTAGASPCAANLFFGFALRIPIVMYSGQAFWADLTYNPATQGLVFVTGGEVLDTSPFSGCAPATLSSAFKLHLPSVMYQGVSYWADLINTTGYNFALTGGGQN